MKVKHCVNSELLFTAEKVITKSYYVSFGYIIVYTITEQGVKQVLRIYGKDSIVSSKSFDKQAPSGFYLWASPGAYLLSISYKDMLFVYQEFAETQELARLIWGDWNEREFARITQLNQEALPLVEQFYTQYEDFLKSKKLLSDADIASYLLISVSSLRSARTFLFEAGRLKKPNVGNYK
jgi:CRP-like cAMP-binding protein